MSDGSTEISQKYFFFHAFSDTILLLLMHCIRRKIINIYMHLLVTRAGKKSVRQKIYDTRFLNHFTFPISMIYFSCLTIKNAKFESTVAYIVNDKRF